jgi:hypothetical protein
MELKLNTKVSTIEEIITSLEKLKEYGKSKGKTKQVTNDNIYNELENDLSKPIGLDIANKWESQYSILNTDKWKVPTTRPPVCVNTAPCQVCPSSYSGYVDLASWDIASKLSNTNINKQWAKKQN